MDFCNFIYPTNLIFTEIPGGFTVLPPEAFAAFRDINNWRNELTQALNGTLDQCVQKDLDDLRKIVTRCGREGALAVSAGINRFSRVVQTLASTSNEEAYNLIANEPGFLLLQLQSDGYDPGQTVPFRQDFIWVAPAPPQTTSFSPEIMIFNSLNDVTAVIELKSSPDVGHAQASELPKVA